MRTTGFFILIMLAAFYAKAQYTVIKVTGTVYTKTGAPIKPGMQLSGISAVNLTSADQKVFVVKLGEGDAVFSLKPDPASKAGALLAFVTKTHPSSGSLGGRGQLFETIPMALQTAPGSNGKVLMGQQNKLLFDTKEFPQNNGSAFFIQVQATGERPETHKLKTSNDTLFINAADLATKTPGMSVQYQLGYFNKDSGKSQLVTSFDPYIDPDNEIENMIASTVAAYAQGKSSEVAVKDSVYDVVYRTTGKPNAISFQYFFSKYWHALRK